MTVLEASYDHSVALKTNLVTFKQCILMLKVNSMSVSGTQIEFKCSSDCLSV